MMLDTKNDEKWPLISDLRPEVKGHFSFYGYFFGYIKYVPPLSHFDNGLFLSALDSAPAPQPTWTVCWKTAVPPPTLSKRRWARTLPPSCSERFCSKRGKHKKMHKSRFWKVGSFSVPAKIRIPCHTPHLPFCARFSLDTSCPDMV